MELGKRIASAGLMAAVLMGGMVLAGCEDKSVEVQRDPSIKIARGMTWAWRPAGPPPATQKVDAQGRPVVSRDVISSNPSQTQHLESNRDWNTEANRATLRAAIESKLKSKGLVQSADPATADFLVDYHVSVKTARGVEEMYPGWGWWGPPAYRPVRMNEGAFVIDIGARDPRKLAYRAIGYRSLGYGYNRTISSYQAEEAVGHLLHDLKTK